MKKIIIRLLIGLSVVVNVFLIYALVVFNQEINNNRKQIVRLENYSEKVLKSIGNPDNSCLDTYKEMKQLYEQELDNDVTLEAYATLIACMQNAMDVDISVYEYETSLENNLIDKGILQKPTYKLIPVDNFLKELKEFKSILD